MFLVVWFYVQRPGTPGTSDADYELRTDVWFVADHREADEALDNYDRGNCPNDVAYSDFALVMPDGTPVEA